MNSLTEHAGEPILFQLRRWLGARWFALLTALVAWTYSILLVNRGWWTDLGEASFPRIWGYFVSWTDFGFARRSLVGTLLVESRLIDTVSDPYVFARLVYSALLTCLLVILSWAVTTTPVLYSNPLLVVAVLLSPGGLAHLGYSIGSQDVVLAIIALATVLLVPSRNWILAVSLTIAGVLVHDLYALMVPAIIAIRAIANPRRGKFLGLESIGMLVAAAVALFAALTVGQLTVSPDSYGEVINPRISSDSLPLSGSNGYFELTSGIGDNQQLGYSLADLAGSWPYIAIPLAYVVVLGWAVVGSVQASSVSKAVLGLSLALPLLASFYAFDFYRWVGLSAILGIIALVAFVRSRILTVPRLPQVMLAAASLLAPIGAFELTRPFPVHQWLWERLVS